MLRRIVTSLLGALISYSCVMAQHKVENFQQPFPVGQLQPTTKNFTGDVWVARIHQVDSLKLPAYNVTFAPGCINSWHYHTEGQVLVATAGAGFYQEKGKAARRLHAGDIVEIAPNVVHWHGAAPESWFAHIAMMPNPAQNKTIWQEPVGDEAYRQAVHQEETQSLSAQSGLSLKEKSIIDLGMFTGKGDLDGVARSVHQALEAGMTQNEIKEVLIQAYAYCGFPRSLRAIQTMMAVVDKRKSQGKIDPEGQEASVSQGNENKYRKGQATLAQLTGVPASDKLVGYGSFAPTIDRFLKEHLFADIFERDLLTYRERELATVSLLAGVGGVEPMVQAHMGICLHLGIRWQELAALVQRVEHHLGKTAAVPLKRILDGLRK